MKGGVSGYRRVGVSARIGGYVCRRSVPLCFLQTAVYFSVSVFGLSSEKQVGAQNLSFENQPVGKPDLPRRADFFRDRLTYEIRFGYHDLEANQVKRGKTEGGNCGPRRCCALVRRTHQKVVRRPPSLG